MQVLRWDQKGRAMHDLPLPRWLHRRHMTSSVISGPSNPSKVLDFPFWNRFAWDDVSQYVSRRFHVGVLSHEPSFRVPILLRERLSASESEEFLQAGFYPIQLHSLAEAKKFTRRAVYRVGIALIPAQSR